MTKPRETDHLWTPEWIVEIAEAFFRDALVMPSDEPAIDLDPCWNNGSPVRARMALTVDDDSLSLDGWALPGVRSIWLNPPYSRPGPFLAMLDSATRYGHGKVGLALVKHDHSTRWWQQSCRYRPMCMLNKRPKFGGCKSGGTFPSTIVLFDCLTDSATQERERTRLAFRRHFGPVGEVRA